MTSFRDTLKTRFGVLGIVVVLVIGVLAVRLWSIQVLRADEYVALAEENRVREFSIEAPRGEILDREGRPLVTNRPALAVTVDPAYIDDDELLERLSEVLGMDVAEIEERLSSVREERLKPRVLMLDVPMDVVSHISEHAVEFPGVAVETVPVREYPNGNVAAHVLGYTGEISEEQIEDNEEFSDYALGDVVGKAGVERSYESVLRGDEGFVRVEVDARGLPHRVLERREPIPGRDIALTLDIDAQMVAEQALVQALDEAEDQDFPNARAGAAVALDARTGEVIAMASVPTYDPTLFIGGIGQEEWEALNDEDSEYPLNNRAVMSAYPPASTFKAITGIAGLEEGVTNLSKGYYCAGKWTEMGEQWPKHCWKRTGHGNMGFMSGMRDSCDTVFYEIGYEFYKRRDERLQAYSRSFGLGEQTGIDLPGEVPGRVPDASWKREYNSFYPEYQTWLPGDTVNMAIGQGDMLTTPLQMASVFGTLGNDGVMMRPHLMQEVIGPTEDTSLLYEPVIAHEPPVSAENLDIIRRALTLVTESGTAEDAWEGFPTRVAGKTGTAEVRGKDDYAWFAAYAPADDPQYAVAVVIEEGGSGGGVAAPATRQILSSLLGYEVEWVQATDESR